VVVWVGGGVVVVATGAGVVVVATGAGAGAAWVVGTGAVAVVEVLRATVVVEEGDDDVGALGPLVLAELDACDVEGVPAALVAALRAAARVDATIDAADALALCAVVASAETMRRSLAKVALRRASVLALSCA
jgi:hypothetical protein